MQTKQGLPAGSPCFLIYRLCYCSPDGERGVGGPPARRACRPAGASGRRGIRHHARATGSDFSASGTRLGCRRQEGPASVGRPSGGRGAPLPVNPCSFVAGHHVSRGGWADRRVGVVLRSPLTLVPSSRGTTSLGSDGLTARCFLKSDA